MEEILQCINCNSFDNQNDKKLIIEQILNFPVHKVQNFPPVSDQNQGQQIRKIMENYSQEKIKKFREQIDNQIDGYYKKILEELSQILSQQKVEVKKQFELFFKFTDFSEIYNVDQLKKSLLQYQKKEIDLEELFEIQKEIKKKFEQEEFLKMAFAQEKIQDEIQKQLGNLELLLDQKLAIFKEDISVNKEEIFGIQKEIQFAQQGQNEEIQKNQKNKENKENLQENQGKSQIGSKNSLELSKTGTRNKTIQFFKSKYGHQQKKIIIGNNYRKISFYQGQYHSKQVFSEKLEKNLRYHFRIKADFYGNNYQNVQFFLLDEGEKDKQFVSCNGIQISDRAGNWGNNFMNVKKVKEGLGFAGFLRDGQSVLNVVFNCQQKVFEVYDDEKKGYVRIELDLGLIGGDFCLFGIQVYQDEDKQYLDFNIIDVIVS
ncbi:hypothetical protein PPERSA_10950 [Pseudocohnilembus persalinus]|uniref:Uncharacterized protein n=1 Tax=Pseudocohnilembus persalinus TaxID=266149 RepID=A0A0V0QCJ4_PSEPJ|nr:hypothetical protein PPERSA_10950 [Pseudocohnilembus persalinus]|eukprot:KRW99831.1 hypothetical protein PPERSA_10950 [Pseudocohnilembus persalinus]